MNRRQFLCRLTFLPGVLLWADGCSSPAKEAAIQAKIQLDLEAIGDDGLIGPPGGRRAMHYEFCIPADPQRAAEVQGIDPSVVISEDSQGRIGCGPDEWLCLGHTHQPEARDVLRRLARLPYVYVIRPCFWE